jgi:transcriptional regulator with XRE-family HTH domain
MPRPRKRPATELSEFLDEALKRKGLSHTQFSRRVGLSPSSLSDLKLRQEAAAPDRTMARRWAQVLGLSETEEHDLFELLQLAHSPAYVQEMVAKLRPSKHLRRVAEPPEGYPRTENTRRS